MPALSKIRLVFADNGTELVRLIGPLRRGRIRADAELRIVSCSADMNGDLRSCAVLFEEAVNGLEQNPFPAADHLRNGCLHTCDPRKSYCSGINSIGAVQLDIRAGNGVFESRQIDDAVGHAEVPCHIRSHRARVRRMNSLRVSLSA